MPTRPIFNKKNYDQAIKDGLGQGSFENYKPWHNVYHIKSMGNVHRTYSTWTLPPNKNRTFHFFSDLEYRWFLVFDWDPNVIDINEQYPLPLEYTLPLAREKGIRHPVETRDPDRHPLVFTTDFKLTLSKNGKKTLQVRSVKYRSAFKNERTKEKLEIERAYWETQDLTVKNKGFAFLTESGVTKTLAHNIERVRGTHFLNEMLEIPHQQKLDACAHLFEQLKSGNQINQSCRATQQKFGLPSGAGLTLLFHMIARRSIPFDLRKKFRTDIPVPINNFDYELLPNEEVQK